MVPELELGPAYETQGRHSVCDLMHRRLRLLKLRVCDYPNPRRQRGIVLLRLTLCEGKSLADASGYDNSLCVHPVHLPKSKMRNFKTCGLPLNDLMRSITKKAPSPSDC